MKKIILAGKILSITFLVCLGILSLLMFPFLIGDDDRASSIIGYSYFGLLLLSSLAVYFIIRNDLKSV